MALGPRILRAGLLLSAVGALLPALVTLRTLDARAHGSETYQRNPPFQPGYLRLVRALEAVVPEDAGLLLTPNAVEEKSGKGRWFLHLSLDLAPRRVFVRDPARASGLTEDYQSWLRRERQRLVAEAAASADDARAAAAEGPGDLDPAELRARAIDWELRYPVTRLFAPERCTLRRFDGERWRAVELPLERQGARDR